MLLDVVDELVVLDEVVELLVVLLDVVLEEIVLLEDVHVVLEDVDVDDDVE